jgi:hypothetical protein
MIFFLWVLSGLLATHLAWQHHNIQDIKSLDMDDWIMLPVGLIGGPWALFCVLLLKWQHR